MLTKVTVVKTTNLNTSVWLVFYLTILTTVTLPNADNALPDDGVTVTLKNVGAVLM